MQNDSGEKPLTEKQQMLIALLYSGKLPIPRITNVPFGFDLENVVEETKFSLYRAIVNRDLDIKCFMAYWRTALRHKVYDEIKKLSRIRFVSLDDDSIPPETLEKFMADPTALEKIHERVNMELLFKKFVDNLKDLSGLQKALIKYSISGLSKKEIAAKTGLPLSQFDLEIKRAKNIFKRELRKYVLRKERGNNDREG